MGLPSDPFCYDDGSLADFPVPVVRGEQDPREEAYVHLHSPLRTRSPQGERFTGQKLRLSSLIPAHVLRSPPISSSSSSDTSSLSQFNWSDLDFASTSQRPYNSPSSGPTSLGLTRAVSAPVYMSASMVRDASSEEQQCPICLESILMRFQGLQQHIAAVSVP